MFHKGVRVVLIGVLIYAHVDTLVAVELSWSRATVHRVFKPESSKAKGWLDSKVA